MSKEQKFIDNMTRLRGMDFVRLEMAVEINGERGRVVGMNASANLDVVFEDTAHHGAHPRNCHPQWEIVYFSETGEVIADYRQATPGGPYGV